MSARPNGDAKAGNAKRVARRGVKQVDARDDSERASELIEESLEESFPASDPPSWTVTTRLGRPR